jgi:fatty acid desaturase
LVFLVGAFFLLVIVFLVIGLLLGLLMAVLAMISPKLMMVGVFVLYLPIVLGMYPLMFAGHYFVWKSMLGGGPSPVPATAAAAVAA